MKTKIILALSALILTTQGAVAQEKFALVISNSDYRMIPSLPQAHDDALAMIDGLEAKGFQVTLVHNSTLGFHNFTFERYRSQLQAAEAGSVGIVYFVGHGLSQNGVNYLLPIDVPPNAADDIASVGIDVGSLTVDLSGDASKRAFVVIDCCESNPVNTSDEGLLAMSAPEGNRIVFASPEDEMLAADATFTQDLVAALLMPEATIASALDAVDPTFVVTPEAVVTEPVDVPEAAESAAVVEPEEVAQSAPVEAEAATSEDVAVDVVPEIVEPETVADAEVDVAMPDIVEPEAVAEAAQQVDPIVEEERVAWDALQGNAGSSDLLAFLGQYPDGAFADNAKDMLVQVLAAEQLTPVLTVPAEDITAPASDVAADIAAAVPAESAPAEAVVVTFTSPLTQGDPAVVGKTIADLIKGTPLFPPVEGLPEAYWKEQTCSSCHTWEEANLCDQANTYLTEAGSANLTKEHPYGGSFKQNIRDWAIGGCTP